jgi:hypothetical protein
MRLQDKYEQLTIVVLTDLAEAKQGEIAEPVADLYLADLKNAAEKQ